ncbi:hypothetical protein GH714_025163 [Hevea brasiliensis]|uniref:Uncharacterized protein n=1 Tax=Hevea brasiliensis TaxID=3981 RepID=A0A6A6M3F3_HEVBR|nr:hypothetical protein GH714_025163 [Hevea brasiliensis]
MYDFQGMNSRLQSCRQLEPCKGHQVRNLSWSPIADRFLCVTGSAQAEVLPHIFLFLQLEAAVENGILKTKETILTSSEDGSLRMWDVNGFRSQKQVIKPKHARPGRIPVTTRAWDHEGKCIAGGIGDGSIQIWNLKPGWGSRPDVHVEKAHSDEITGLKFSSDGRILLSRSFDGLLTVWDLRKMKDSLHAFDDLPNHNAQTNIAFSPDEKLFLTGTSVERESTTGGDKSQGGTHILYDETGALVCVARAPRKKSVDNFEAQPVIHNPHALPLFRDQPSRQSSEQESCREEQAKMRLSLPTARQNEVQMGWRHVGRLRACRADGRPKTRFTGMLGACWACGPRGSSRRTDEE